MMELVFVTMMIPWVLTFSADPVSTGPGAAGPEERGANEAEQEYEALLADYVEKFRPLWTQQAQAWWQASITGTDEAFQKRKDAERAFVELHSDRATFDRLDSFRKGGRIRQPQLRRQLELMYLAFLPSQADPELRKQIVALEAEADQIFNTHRGMIDSAPKTENDIREILAETSHSAAAEKAWKAYMAVGGKVEPKLKTLVRLRNQVAIQLGFAHYFAMQMALQEIDQAQLFDLFDELDELTRRPFAELKANIDRQRAARFSVPVADLRPWHYGDLFFQQPPATEEVSLDDILEQREMVKLSGTYYASLGLPIDDIIARSDLYEKNGKTPHAFCTDMDRAGDVRVLCNLKPTAYWMDTLLHELGHGVYDKYLSPKLPFLLREAAHAITTEGIAMMFGAMVMNEDWLRNVLKLPEDQAARFVAAAHDKIRAEKLIFSRWAQVMVRFEYGMYSDPGQDLGRLWYDLKKRYQLLNPSDEPSRPDYGAKMHIVGSPVYYHSYMMGDLFACQVQNHVAGNILGLEQPTRTSFFGRKEAGDYLRARIFGPGKRLAWNELTEAATGEPLSARHFVHMYLD